MKHAIYGKITFENGIVIDWLRFIDHSLSLEDAKQEAVRVVTAQHKGMAIVSVVTI